MRHVTVLTFQVIGQCDNQVIFSPVSYFSERIPECLRIVQVFTKDSMIFQPNQVSGSFFFKFCSFLQRLKCQHF